MNKHTPRDRKLTERESQLIKRRNRIREAIAKQSRKENR